MKSSQKSQSQEKEPEEIEDEEDEDKIEEVNDEEPENATPDPEDNLENNLNFAKALKKNTGLEPKTPLKTLIKKKGSQMKMILLMMLL